MLLKVFLPLSLSIIMLGMGLSLTIADFARVFKQPKATLIGLSNQIFVFPALAFLLAIAFNLSTPMAVGLVIIASCPGGPTSNIITQVCKGNLALSVTLTAIVSITSIFTLSFITSYALSFFSTQADAAIQLPVLETIVQIMLITVIPVSIGMVFRKYKYELTLKMIKPMKIVSTSIFILLFLGVVAINANEIGDALKEVGLVTLLLNIGIIASGFLLIRISKLSNKDAIAVGVDGGIQNASVGLVVATTILDNVEMAIPIAAYTIWMYITGGILMWWYSRKGK